MDLSNSRFWVGVASKEHVEKGVKLSICQFCHGKSSQVRRLSKDDYRNNNLFLDFLQIQKIKISA